MRVRRRSSSRTLTVLGVAVLVALTAFGVWQVGVPAYVRAQGAAPVSATESLALPAQVYDPPAYTPSTDDWGPPGPLGLVFEGRRASEGFTGEVDRPWYGVSARDGAYARIDAPHLDRALGRLALSPQGTRVAWWWPGGIACYDTMSGQTRAYNVRGPVSAGDVEPLVWSPDSGRLAFGHDPVRVLDLRTGRVRDLPLRLAAGAGNVPAWTADGRWVTAAGDDAIRAVNPSTGRRRTMPVRVGDLRGARWSQAGDVAGLHPRDFGAVLRVVRARGVAEGGAAARVADESPKGLTIEDLWGWADRGDVVLAGLRPETGALEQAMAVSLAEGTVQPYVLMPTQGDNWVGLRTVSPATDLLGRPAQEFEKPPVPWSPEAKLLACLLVVVFPALYFLIARRPRH